jgi:hypothetical protein
MTHDDTHNEPDPLTALREELAAVTSSPAFAAGVRRRIDTAREEQAASWWRAWWMVPAGATLTVALAIGVVQLRPSGPKASEPSAVETTVRTGEPAAPTVAGPTVPARGVETRAAQSVAVASRVSPVMPAVVPAPTQDGPDMRVITNQPAVLSEMWKRVRSTEASLVATSEVLPLEIGDVFVRPVEVQPIVVPWLVEPPDAGGGPPAIRKVTADPAERSEK